MRSGWRSRIASLGISSRPTPRATAPARIKCDAFCRFTPPAAISGMWGNILLRESTYFSPPIMAHGTTLTKSDFASQTARTSVGVNAPGKTTSSRCAANSMMSGWRLAADAEDRIVVIEVCFGELQRHAVHLHLDGNRYLLFHFFGGTPRPMLDRRDVVVSDVGI